MIDRKPSHFGSKLSAPSGISFTDLASIGETGGMTGSRISSQSFVSARLGCAFLARLGCTRAGSPSIFGKFGG